MKKNKMAAAVLLACICAAQPVYAEEFGTVCVRGLNLRTETFYEMNTIGADVETQIQLYQECAEAEYSYISQEVDMEQLTAQQKYYVDAVKKQADAFENAADTGAALILWKEAQLERYRALFYMNLDGIVTEIDPDLLFECRTLLGDEEEKEELVREFQLAIGLSSEQADGKFGATGREYLRQYVNEKSMDLAFISDLNLVNNAYITWDLLKLIRGEDFEQEMSAETELEQEAETESGSEAESEEESEFAAESETVAADPVTVFSAE